MAAGSRAGACACSISGRDANIAPNAKVVTSNWTLHVPQDLPVGFVTKVIRDEQADTLQLEVVPYVNFDSLELVSIILTEEITGRPGTP
jgi:cell shape-determining protein MreC